MVKEKSEIELDGVDLLLIGAIAILAMVTLVLLFPSIWSCCQVVFTVSEWPFWIWTCLGVLVLGVLLWLRSRYE